ncbi:MAG: hypothetical protein H6825_13815 [Planctomycetes bacterium]|nr:hypothetical protein [Planctomycetota bacterium]
MAQVFYDHVQRGRLHVLLMVVSVPVFVGGLLALDEPLLAATLIAVAALFVLLAFSFRELRVRSDGEALEIRFGPLSWMAKTVPFASMRAVAPDRTTLIDGIGVHWIPGRGWIWNVATGPTVRIETEGQTLRVGTDDPEGLLAFLQARTGLAAGDAAG